ncbi:TonB-dependent receptor [Algibacter sp. L4_22]|uniref:TonB-dependent receptor n=1 Tax=Algibacter sp. L4_22 TaxID=2942477 RepID=UPI00201B5745|nr:TonB-dependent receptor [Algibacter sp. L4_22]MCL5127447.1 TonB-dependent receptor [Algibacter sp. L4_22]
MKNIFIVLSLFLTSFLSLNAQGTVAGNVLDGEYNNEPMAFANILVKGTTTGTTSDFDGKYQLSLDAGTYTLIFSFVGYESKEISDIVIKNGQVFDLDVILKSNSLDEIVITTSAKRNTENAVLNIQKKSVTLLDGLSAQSIKSSGASNIAAAVKSVPGVSVEGGKYVYVRGLGDRYTKTTLNGVDIPGLDPDRNTIQMDVFPTSIIDNIIVIKSAAAEFPADFTGGVVDIITKDFPTKFEASLSLGAGFNPSMHGKSNFLIGNSSSTDFFGYDDNSRSRPIHRYQNIPGTFDNRGLLTTLTGRFDSQLRAQEETSKPNFNFGFTIGDQFEVGENDKFGYLASFSYKNSTTFYENRVDGAYSIDANDKSNNELVADRTSNGREGINNVLVNGLVGLTYKTQNSKYRVNVLHIQNGESTGGFFNQVVAQGGSGSGSGYEPLTKDAITYTERSVTNILLNGKHSFGAKNEWDFEWKLSPTISKVHDLDHRVTPLQQSQSGDYFISASAATFPIRIWRFLQEENWAGKIDLSKKYELFGKPAKVKFGGGHTYKFRDFSVDDWTFDNNGTSVLNGNPDNILATENLWSRDNTNGTYLISGDIFNPNDAYEGEQHISSTYISNEFNISEKLKSIIGLRAEIFTSYYTGQDGTDLYNRFKVIDVYDLFPSANFIYAVTDQSNIRTSYYKTTARPSFKEASLSQIFDPVTDRLFIGNIDLKPTYVNNFDLRFENFGDAGAMFAVSAFFKDFTDPLEKSFFASAPTQLTIGNLGSAKVYGAEFEFRKNLGFITESLEDLKFTLNVSVTESELTMSDEEFNSRTANARDGQTIDQKRELQGQAPYLINTSLNYSNSDLGLQTGLFFNMQGETLEVVGLGGVPDVYTKPFKSLNFTLNKAFGENKKSSIDIKVSNILGSNRESVYQSYKAQDQIFSLREPGTEFSIGYAYKF